MSIFPILAVLASLVCILGCWWCCRQPRGLDQAALLPFADDPEAAARMTAATGRRCEHVITPISEALEESPLDRFEA
ncbi:hypothetical protein ABXY51_000878 [Pseudomonas aeruginosa]